MARHKVAEAHIHVHRVAIIDAFMLEGSCLYSMFLKALFTLRAVMLLISYLYQQLVHLLLVICKIENMGCRLGQ